MIWLIWLIFLGVLALCCVVSALLYWFLGQQIRRKQAEIERVRAELAALEALAPEDRAWLASCDPMSEPTHALPAVGSIWVWRPGHPLGREVVTVTSVDIPKASVWFEGPSGDRCVSLADFAAEAEAPTLGHHR